jgi:hypothetical protein
VSIPGSVWQFNGDFTYVVPRMEPSPDGAPSKIPYGVGRVGRMKPVTTVPETTEEPPSHVGFPFVLLSEFGKKMADGVVSVERVGSEALKLNGEDLPCEILKVTYTPSTDEHPHPESVTYWISPAKHLVLKDVLRHSAGRNIESAQWTVIFDSAKFDRPTPQGCSRVHAACLRWHVRDPFLAARKRSSAGFLVDFLRPMQVGNAYARGCRPRVRG